MLRQSWPVLVGLLFLGNGANAQLPASMSEADTLAHTLRELLPALLPNPLYEDTKHWGMQREFERAHWHGLRRELVPEMRNDGRWHRIKVTATALAHWLSVDVFDLKHPSPEKTEFGVTISLETHLEYDRQTWAAGTRLYAGSVRARARGVVMLRCESTVRLEVPKGTLIPDVILQFRVLSGEFKYDNVKIEHLPGFGGDAADLIGEGLLDIIRAIKPSLEQKLLDKANEAIAKAGQTKEVRLSLGKYLKAP
jgi:hypothetical protein